MKLDGIDLKAHRLLGLAALPSVVPPLCCFVLICLFSVVASAQPSFIAFESGHVRPIAISPDGSKLFAVNTPDNQLEIFDIDGSGQLTRSEAVQVGLEPVAVAARSNDEVWVVNFLSDSVSVVDLTGSKGRVVRTLLVGDEPSDIVFAGPSGDRAFITTAHRGQNSPYPRGDYDVEGIGRADVWVFNAASLGTSLGGDEIAILTLFGDKPRALAVSPDGSKVYAAVFHSGNQTTELHEGHLCETNGTHRANDTVQGSCTIGGLTSPGGYPPPHQNSATDERPEVGLIVKKNRDGGVSGDWQDELARDWDAFVRFDLPDRDVFEIDANANPPVAVDASDSCANGSGCWAGVGTVLFNMAVNPISGKIYVSNTDAQNHVRFEGAGTYANGKKPGGEPDTVKGNLAQARITVLDGTNVDARHLNNHIDYSVLSPPSSIKEDSLATPTQMAVSSDGMTLYVAAFGSDKIGIFDTSELENDTFTPDLNDHIQLAGGGPSGVLLHGGRLYVMTRFDNSVRVLNASTKLEEQVVALHNPEPQSIIAGRPFLYSANLTSSNGEASCSSCHIFGDLDDMGWDLGDPDASEVDNFNPFNPVVPIDPVAHTFHPMKGPMSTQSLRGLVNMGPQHWRGDRQGDANAGFNAFNAAIVGLNGNSAPLSTSDMQKFTDFALQLTYPPNPVRNLDNSLRTDSGKDELAGRALYDLPETDVVASCNDCHVLDAASGFFGGDGRTVFDGTNQHLKIPHLRNLYQKIGMFGMSQIEPPPILGPNGPGAVFAGPYVNTGPQIRGWGFTHEGAVDTLFRFLSVPAFDLNDPEQDDVEAFLMVFDTDLAPVVGQQISLTSTNGTTVDPRIQLFIDRSEESFASEILGVGAMECDLVAKVVEAGVERGYLHVGSGDFQPDDGAATITDGALRAKAAVVGQEVTYTCAPPGSGNRMALDRDEDTLFNAVETDTRIFVSASNTGTSPALADTDGDGFDDDVEVTAGTNPNNPIDFPGAPPPPQVPSFSAGGLLALVMCLVLGTGWWLARRRESSVPT